MRSDDFPRGDKVLRDQPTARGLRLGQRDKVLGRNVGGSSRSYQERSRAALAALSPAVEKIRGEFVGKLTGYHARLRSAIMSDAKPEQQKALFDDASFVSHRIAGVGHTLGYSELGAAARRTEAMLAAYKSNDVSVGRDVVIAQIRQLMVMIEAIKAEYGVTAD